MLESPLLEQNHILIEKFSRIYLGVLNYYDIIIGKLFRSTGVDIDDCLMLMKSKNNEIDIEKLRSWFKETAKYDVCEEKANKNFVHFLEILKNKDVKNGK